MPKQCCNASCLRIVPCSLIVFTNIFSRLCKNQLPYLVALICAIQKKGVEEIRLFLARTWWGNLTLETWEAYVHPAISVLVYPLRPPSPRVADPDLQIRGAGGGQPQKFFFGPSGLKFVLKIRVGREDSPHEQVRNHRHVAA